MSLFEAQSKEFHERHIGPDENQQKEMLNTIGVNSLDELIGIPAAHQGSFPEKQGVQELHRPGIL